MLKKWRKKMQRRTGKGNRMDSKKKELYKEKLEKLESIRKEWEKIKKEKKDSQAQNHQLVDQLYPVIKEMKQEDIDVFEQIYWEMKTKVTRDEVYTNAWAGIISFLALIVAILSVFYSTAVGMEDLDLNIRLAFCAAAIMVICLVVGIKDCLIVYFATGERSYYRILVSMMEDMR